MTQTSSSMRMKVDNKELVGNHIVHIEKIQLFFLNNSVISYIQTSC